MIDTIKNDKEKCKEWLLGVVSEAERQFGSKTGALKLRYVYDKFLIAFPFLSHFVDFSEFSDMVDVALEWMKGSIKTSRYLHDYIKGGDT